MTNDVRRRTPVRHRQLWRERSAASWVAEWMGEVLSTPYSRGFQIRAPKQLGEVRLISHAAGQRDLAQRLLSGQHQSLCPLDPEPDEVHVRRHPEADFERTAERADAE